jgi:hypothetical protein
MAFGRVLTTGPSSGPGFTATAPTSNTVQITFAPAFTDPPILTATAEGTESVSISSNSSTSATLTLTPVVAPVIFFSEKATARPIRSNAISAAVHFHAIACVGASGPTGPTGATGSTGP